MDSTMQPSQQLVEFLKAVESFSATPYADAGGKMTIGFGHLLKPGEVFGAISSVEATALFVKDLQPAVAAVNDAVTVPMTQQQFDAAVSLTFNVGEGWTRGSGLLNAINSKAPDIQIMQHWLAWDKIDGTESKGLLNRRQAEWRIWTTGKYPGW